MAGVNVKIPGKAGMVEAEAALMDQAVRYHWNVATITGRRPMPTVDKLLQK